MPARRAARLAELIREEASKLILYDLRDPRIKNVTVTKVELSGDYRHARIYVSVLGDEALRRTVFRGLASARGLIQSRISKTLGIREAPIVNFEFDASIEKAIEVSKLIDRVAAELRQTGPAPAPQAAQEAHGQSGEEAERARDEAGEDSGEPGDEPDHRDAAEPHDEDPADEEDDADGCAEAMDGQERADAEDEAPEDDEDSEDTDDEGKDEEE